MMEVLALKLARKGYYDQFLNSIELPRMVGISVRYDDRHIEDISGVTKKELGIVAASVT